MRREHLTQIMTDEVHHLQTIGDLQAMIMIDEDHHPLDMITTEGDHLAMNMIGEVHLKDMTMIEEDLHHLMTTIGVVLLHLIIEMTPIIETTETPTMQTNTTYQVHLIRI
jgi:hypothetical protein